MIPNNVDKVDFDSVKVEQFERDYSILQFSKKQMEIMEYNLEYLLKKLNISGITLRTVVYQEFIKWQIENEFYLIESENLSAMERLTLTERISQKILERLENILVDKDSYKDSFLWLCVDIKSNGMCSVCYIKLFITIFYKYMKKKRQTKI